MGAFIKSENKFYITDKNPHVVHRLEPGTYKYKESMDGAWFESLNINHDEIVDLPSKAYDKIVGQFEHFLKPETKQKYEELGAVYKRSSLLHGPPGTGKTCIVNRVSQMVHEQNGVVLFGVDPLRLTEVLQVLENNQPEVLTMVILEELDQIVKDPANKNALLSILDGEIQKNNVLYLATTNFIEQIPFQLLRPGRFSSTVEIKEPNAEARRKYLRSKISDQKIIEEITEKTKGFTIDDLKEVLFAHYCLDENLDTVIDRVNRISKVVKSEAPDTTEDNIRSMLF